MIKFWLNFPSLIITVAVLHLLIFFFWNKFATVSTPKKPPPMTTKFLSSNKELIASVSDDLYIVREDALGNGTNGSKPVAKTNLE